MKKIVVRIALNSLLGIILIFVWSRFVNLGEIGQVLQTVDLRYALGFVVFTILSTILRAARLKLLLISYRIPVLTLTALNFLSQFLSFTIPIRAGEVSKSIYLSSRYDLPIGKTVVWILLDRFFDFWAVLLLIAGLLWVLPVNLPQSSVYLVFFGLAGFTLGAAIVLISQNFARRLARLVPPLTKFSLTIIDGFDILRMGPLRWLAVVVLTLLACISDSLVWLSSLWALGVDLTPLQSLLSSSLLSLTFLVPAAPGYVGSAEASGLLILSGVMGVNPTLASSATVFNHLLTAVTLPTLGLISLYFLKFNLGVVWKKLRG